MALTRKIRDAFLIIKEIKDFYKLFFDYAGMIKPGRYTLKLRNGLKVILRSHTGDKSRVKEILLKNNYLKYNESLNNYSVVFDIGANIGLFTIIIGFKYPGVKIHAFEPEEENYKLLLEQIKINNLTNVYASKTAIGAKEEKFRLFKSTNTGGHTLIGDSNFKSKNKITQDFEMVNSTTLINYLAQNNINNISFLKMDIEGGEYDVFFNLANEDFLKIEQIAMEYHFVNDKKNGSELEKLFIGMGYLTKNEYPILHAFRGRT
jgi:FkbM family methyltransferase